jgi:hypothetical protein
MSKWFSANLLGSFTNNLINICMKRYRATVNAGGIWVETILYAQNQADAYRLFKAIFGAQNAPHPPKQVSQL